MYIETTADRYAMRELGVDVGRIWGKVYVTQMDFTTCGRECRITAWIGPNTEPPEGWKVCKTQGPAPFLPKEKKYDVFREQNSVGDDSDSDAFAVDKEDITILPEYESRQIACYVSKDGTIKFITAKEFYAFF